MKRSIGKILSGVILSSLILFCCGLATMADNPKTSAEDMNPPILTHFELKRTNVEAPGRIAVVGDATDEISGISRFSASFCNMETGKCISVDLEKEYWAIVRDKYGEHEQKFAYTDGKFHGYIDIDQYIPSGEYCIDLITVGDKAGNTQDLYGPGFRLYKEYLIDYPDDILPDQYKDLKITVTNKNGTEDVTPPTLTQLELSGTSMEAPGEIDIVADTTDDISGATLITVSFRNKVADKTLNTFLNKDDTATGQNSNGRNRYDTAYNDGKFHGNIYFDRYTPSGEYYIDHIHVVDNAGNSQSLIGLGSKDYNWKQEYHPDDILPDQYKDLKITVTNTNGTEDVTPPTFTEIELGRTSINTPARIEVIGDATDDISGIDRFSVRFRNKETGKCIGANLSDKDPEGFNGIDGEYIYVTLYEDGKFHGYIYVYENTPSGDYYMESILLKDEADNDQTWYGFGAEDYDLYLKNEPKKLLPDKYSNLKIRVTNTGIRLNTTDPALEDNETESDIYFDHWVEKGDTLWGIAKKYRTTVDDLMTLNPNIKDRSLIYVGDLIKYKYGERD